MQAQTKSNRLLYLDSSIVWFLQKLTKLIGETMRRGPCLNEQRQPVNTRVAREIFGLNQAVRQVRDELNVCRILLTALKEQ